MADQQQIRKIKCPHCGWVVSVPIDVIVDESMADVTKGPIDSLKQAAARIRALLANPSLDPANDVIDMPACPNCRRVYRYNVRTGEALQ
ncbi:MAG TPA: hypothetical protein VER55_16415 [Ardenticatenaceae bacterium]|nr:hypothetical protein [Ardenticatenaceae bacterium]